METKDEQKPQWLIDAEEQGRQEAAAKAADRQQREEEARQAEKEHMLATAKERYLRSGGTESGWEKDKEAVYESVLRNQAAEAIAEEDRQREAASAAAWRNF